MNEFYIRPAVICQVKNNLYLVIKEQFFGKRATPN